MKKKSILSRTTQMPLFALHTVFFIVIKLRTNLERRIELTHAFLPNVKFFEREKEIFKKKKTEKNDSVSLDLLMN